MGHLRVRHVDDAVIERLMRQADGLGMPVEAYLCKVLTDAAHLSDDGGATDGAPASEGNDPSDPR
ncbi:MAG: hypothetical protein HQM01_02185 [Magnetococcales bacterium]|nr:hypothetical protein [Magnetococcales bacterium]